MKKLLQYYEIDFLISTNSPRSERAAIEAASMLSIPSICVVDGFAKYESEWIANPGFSTKVCVFSDSVKKNLEKLGRSQDDIIVTGNPSFDMFYAPFQEKKIHQFRQEAGIPDDKKLVLYAPSNEGKFHIYNGRKANTQLPEKVLKKLIQFIKERKEYFLIVRPHPSYEFNTFSFSERVLLDQGFDLLTLLHASDIVVTTASTVGIQAQIVGKPLVCVNLSVYAEDINYEEFGEVVRISSLDELDKAIICATNEHKKYVKKVKMLNATQKILNVFDTLIEKENKLSTIKTS
jgi:predicted glycosyltransferase